MISILNLTFSVSYDNGKLYDTRDSLNLGLIFEHIINLAEVSILDKSQVDTHMGFYRRYAKQIESKLTAIQKLWYRCEAKTFERNYSESNSFKG